MALPTKRSAVWFKLVYWVSVCKAATDTPYNTLAPKTTWICSLRVNSVVVSWRGQPQAVRVNTFLPVCFQQLSVRRVAPASAAAPICGATSLTSLWRPWWQTAETQFSWPAEQWVERRGWHTSTLSSVCPSHAEPGEQTRRQCHLYKSLNVTLFRQQAEVSAPYLE